MPKVRNITPKMEREPGAGRAMRPFTHSMESFFENAWPRRWMEGFFEPYGWKRTPWFGFDEEFEPFPRVDILDHEDVLLVRAEMPGIRKEDLEITIAGDRLTLEAKREFGEEEKKEDYFRSEMGFGRIYRVIHLPVEIVGEETKAELKDGIVEIRLPKVEATTPHRVRVA